MQGDLEAVGLVGRYLGVAQRRPREDVGGRADALPQRDGASGRAEGLIAVELPLRPVLRAGLGAAGVVVAGEDDRCLQSARQVPEARQRCAVGGHLRQQVGQQALLLIRGRRRHPIEVDPVGLDIADLGAEEHVVGADRHGVGIGESVALLAGPRRVALAGVDDRPGQVVGEGGGLPAAGADVADRDRRVGRRRAGVVVEARDRAGAAERVAVGGVVELHQVGGDACPRRLAGVDLQVGVAQPGRPGRGNPQQWRERGVRTHGDELAPALHPVRHQRRLRPAQPSRGEHDDARAAQRLGAQAADVDGGELVEALRAQDLRVVTRERVTPARHDENRAAGRRLHRRACSRGRQRRDQAHGHRRPTTTPSRSSDDVPDHARCRHPVLPHRRVVGSRAVARDPGDRRTTNQRPRGRGAFDPAARLSTVNGGGTVASGARTAVRATANRRAEGGRRIGRPHRGDRNRTPWSPAATHVAPPASKSPTLTLGARPMSAGRPRSPGAHGEVNGPPSESSEPELRPTAWQTAVVQSAAPLPGIAWRACRRPGLTTCFCVTVPAHPRAGPIKPLPHSKESGRLCTCWARSTPRLWVGPATRRWRLVRPRG